MLHASTWRPGAHVSRQPAAAILLSAAGALHLGAAPEHWGHSPAHGMFLLAIGIGEMLWAAVFWSRPSPGMSATGAVLAGGSIVLWAITRVLPAPFGHGAEEIGAMDLASKMPEMLVLAMLLAEDSRRPKEQRAFREPVWIEASAVLILASVAGALTFWAATAAQSALPWLADGDAAENAIVRASSAADPADRIRVMVAGIPAPYASGDNLPIAGDLEAQISIAPGAARFDRELTLRLLHSDDESVAGAAVVAAGHMRYMDHGAFRQAASPSDNGEYVLPLSFAMRGEWQIDLDVSTPTEHGIIQLELDLVD